MDKTDNFTIQIYNSLKNRVKTSFWIDYFRYKHTKKPRVKNPNSHFQYSTMNSHVDSLPFGMVMGVDMRMVSDLIIVSLSYLPDRNILSCVLMYLIDSLPC